MGSFLVSYYLGFILNLLGNIGDIYERIITGQRMDTYFYLFLILYFVLFIFGIWFQKRTLRKMNEVLEYDSVKTDMLAI